jgi:hypothetical protein
MKKNEFLKSLRTGREEWEALLARVGEEHMLDRGVAGDWSVKDIIAHVTWHENEMLSVVRARALVGSELWGLSVDQRNAAIFEQNQGRPLPDVLAEAQQVHEQLVTELQTLSDEDLTDASRFRDWPADWVPDFPPGRVIASNTFEHYHDHIPAIEDWLHDVNHADNS